MSNFVYKDWFYETRFENTERAAEIVVDVLLSIIPFPVSVVDVGCGIGVWLSKFRERGCVDILGVDGTWVKKDCLVIDEGQFHQQDLNSPIKLGRRFDLAVSLEVAEHLLPSAADQFVNSLVGLSDFVLFAAAPPLQGGTNHINEQPIDYWVEKFEEYGYTAVDALRPLIWNDSRIPGWYRQNVFLAVKSDVLSRLVLSNGILRPNGYLHPDIFLEKLEYSYSLKGSWKIFRRALRRAVFSGF